MVKGWGLSFGFCFLRANLFGRLALPATVDFEKILDRGHDHFLKNLSNHLTNTGTPTSPYRNRYPEKVFLRLPVMLQRCYRSVLISFRDV